MLALRHQLRVLERKLAKPRSQPGDRLVLAALLADSPLRPLLMEIGGRKVRLAGITAHPTGDWVTQQARNLAWKLQDGGLRARFLLREWSVMS